MRKTAAVLIIGDEILSGKTKDVNIGYIAEKLTSIGIDMKEARVVSDDYEHIIATLNNLRTKFDYVFTCGGIGPTHDDITSAAIARAFGVDLIEHPEAMLRLTDYYIERQLPLNEARRKMGIIPTGAKLIDNPISTAPGFYLENVFTMAGVPRIMQAMLDFVLPMLQKGTPIKSATLTESAFEGDFAADLTAIAAKYKTLSFGSYPHMIDGKISTSIVIRGDDDLSEAENEIKSMLEKYKR
jgi:molybdenum cofactor synthesis domain-containing protein